MRKTPWSHKDGASPDTVKPGLPDERKALVERYMIDAEEAESRVRLAAEEATRRATEEVARREVADADARRAADEEAGRFAAEQAQREAEEHARREAEEQTQREAERRTQREAEERARREAEEHARRAAEEPIRREAEEQPVAVAAPETEAHHVASPLPDDSPPEQLGPPPAPAPTNDEFPIYSWLQQAKPEPDAAADWTRELVEARERRDSARLDPQPL